MTKNKIVGAIAALGLLSAPAVAVAHGGGDDHGRHQGKSHHQKKHQKKGKSRDDVTGKATGTVTSFAAGELTIALPNGKTYSALVTKRTVIKCRTAAPQGSTTTPSTTAPATTATPASTVLPVKAKKSGHDHGDDDHRGGRHDDGDDNDHGDDRGNGRCGTDALVAGAKVTKAKLSLKDGEATWKKVELLK